MIRMSEPEERDESVWDVRFAPCCEDMDEVVMMNDLRQGVLNMSDGKWGIVWSDGDITPLRYCPCCGKKIEPKKDGRVHNKEMFSRTWGSQITDEGWDILAKSMEREKNGKFGSFRPEWEGMDK